MAAVANAGFPSLGAVDRNVGVACLLNILAKLRSVPFVDFPLIDYVQRIIEVREERVYFVADS